ELQELQRLLRIKAAILARALPLKSSGLNKVLLLAGPGRGAEGPDRKAALLSTDGWELETDGSRPDGRRAAGRNVVDVLPPVDVPPPPEDAPPTGSRRCG